MRVERRPTLLSSLECISLCIAATTLICMLTAQPSQAQTFTSLFSFDYSDGANPHLAPLTQGEDGGLYGTTSLGGANGPYGTIFRVTPSGAETVLYSLDGELGGAYPTAALVLGTDGNFYGTTEEGGGPNYSGSVFELSVDGTLTTLHAFCTKLVECPDGAQPDAALIQGRDGNFYGTTQNGGTSGTGSGTIFRITPHGKLTTIYSFCAPKCSDGGFPNASLIQASDGDFYGTTPSTIFKITPAGRLTTLHTLTQNDGSLIISPLIQASDGNFYGTASAGGPANDGTIFRFTRKGEYTVLHSFDGSDGISPEGGLVQASDGNLYGTTFEGGSKLNGTVFKITLGGELTTIYNFCLKTNCVDGSEPASGLLQGTNGILYGTTSSGGTYNEGTVFSVAARLPPFVSLIPARGKVGTSVGILGQGFRSATGVLFNGAPAPHTVVSDTFLTALVPADSTNGPVTVKVAAGVLDSSTQFDVIPIEASFSPPNGTVGTQVTIKGGGFLGTRKVTFGGTKAAAFTVLSGSEITAAVPVGAKTGKIAITTAGGTATAGTFTID
jgi:uncharacterized repeat protein (TIGR03803 family)